VTAPKVTLYWTGKTPGGWKRYPAAIERNGKVRPRYAQVGGAQQLFETGHYECRHLEDGKTVWKNVGEDASIARAEQLHLTSLTDLKSRPPRLLAELATRFFRSRHVATVIAAGGLADIHSSAIEFSGHSFSESRQQFSHF
jgi:hypothetical protein